MQSRVFELDTSRRRLVDLTDEVRSFCPGQGHGLCNVLVPHATAGVAIFETATLERPLRGTWQSIVLVDLNSDNPRRSVRLSFVKG